MVQALRPSDLGPRLPDQVVDVGGGEVVVVGEDVVAVVVVVPLVVVVPPDVVVVMLGPVVVGDGGTVIVVVGENPFVGPPGTDVVVGLAPGVVLGTPPDGAVLVGGVSEPTEVVVCGVDAGDVAGAVGPVPAEPALVVGGPPVPVAPAPPPPDEVGSVSVGTVLDGTDPPEMPLGVPVTRVVGVSLWSPLPPGAVPAPALLPPVPVPASAPVPPAAASHKVSLAHRGRRTSRCPACWSRQTAAPERAGL